MRRSGRKNLIVLDSSIDMSVKRNTKRRYSSIDERRREALLKIIICFVVPVVVVLAAWGVVSVAAEIMEPDLSQKVQQSSVVDEDNKFGDSDSLTVLIIKISDDKSVGEQFLLMRFEPAEDQVYVASFDPKTVAQGVTLADHFAADGASGCASAISALTGCQTVWMAQMSYSNIKKLVTQLGGVTITVPYNIDYQSPGNDRNLNVAAGTRIYEGGETARLLNYPNWKGGEEEHRKMYQSVLCSAINEQLTGRDSQQVQELFTLFYGNCSSDITMGTYQRASVGLAHLASLKTDKLALAADFSPTEKEDGSFVFEGDELKLLQAVFGDRGR